MTALSPATPSPLPDGDASRPVNSASGRAAAACPGTFGTIDLAPRRSAQTWRTYLQAQAKTILAVDFFHVGTVFVNRLCVLSAVERGTRRVHLAGIIARPAGEWVTQQARDLPMNLQDRADGCTFLIRDRDATFTAVGSSGHSR